MVEQLLMSCFGVYVPGLVVLGKECRVGKPLTGTFVHFSLQPTTTTTVVGLFLVLSAIPEADLNYSSTQHHLRHSYQITQQFMPIPSLLQRW